MRLIQEFVEMWAQQIPEATAVVYDNNQWTYRELDSHANILAHILINKNIGPGSRVGIGFDPSYEMIISIVAVLKTGAAYVPLDPAYPSARLLYMIEQSNLSLVLTKSSSRDHWFDSLVHCVEIPKLDTKIVLKPPCEISSDNLAYVIFTSGSTGQPKGVMGHHRGLCNLVHVHKETLGLTHRDRVLQCASLSFDAASWEIFMALGTGATLVLCDRDTRRSSESLARFIERQEISVVTLMSTMLSLLEVSSDSLRLVISAGEACSKDIAQKWAKHCAFVNAYGPTETTVCATLGFYDPHSNEDPSIGRPIAHTQVYILDENMRLVPDNSPGELFISGVCVALGYLNNSELSAEKFVPDLFDKNKLMYRSGDRAYFDTLGEIRFLGRLDDQVKLRGYRIELAEIEHALLRHELVKSAAVVLREDSQKYLAAYIASDSLVSPSFLREYLSTLLPDYMIPRTFHIMKTLPLNAHQKIDRQKLKKDSFRTELSSTYVEPRDSEERELARIWCKAFKLTQIGIHDNFFELGGHSLLMTQIIAESCCLFNTNLSLDIIFKAPTIAQFAQLASSKNTRNNSLKTPIRDPHAPVPLTSGQKQIWFAQQIIGDLPVFNIPVGLKITGKLDIAHLQHALNLLIERHEVFRTIFLSVRGLPQQIVGPQRSCEISHIFLKDLPGELERYFNLERDLLMRAALIQNSPDEHLLFISVHHIIFDGWSHDILIRDLTYFLGHKNDLDKLTQSYADYAYSEICFLQEKENKEREIFWFDLLKDYKNYPELAPDFKRPPMRSYRGSSRKISIPQSLFFELRRLNAREGASSYMTLLAILYILLMRHTSHEKLVIGGIGANRKEFSTQNVVGLFANMMALPIDMSKYKKYPALLKSIRELVISAQMHQEIPFDAVVRALGISYEAHRSPLFQIMFRYETQPEIIHIDKAALEISVLDLDSHTSKLDLELIAVERESSMSLIMQFDELLFKPERIDAMLQDFVVIMQEFISNYDQE